MPEHKVSRILRIPVYMNAVVFLVLIPFLELSPTHVFNPDWPAHARLHEVWQLVTNAVVSIMAVILVWRERHALIGGAMALTINAGFLAALISADLYGGGMAHSDGSELLIGGVNPASIVIGSLSLMIAAGVFRERRSGRARQ